MNVITRAQWGAKHADGGGPAPVPYERTYLHHSVTLAPDLGWLDADRDGVDDDEEEALRLLERIGQDRFGQGISYTWLVPPSGRIYQGHSVDRLGAHTGGLNGIARAICLIGDYSNRAPTDAQIVSVAWLLQHNARQSWTKVAALTGGHRDVKGTACPGDRAYAAIPLINRLAAGPAITEEDCVTAGFTAGSKAAYDDVYHTLVSGKKRDGAINRDLGFLRESILADNRVTRDLVAKAMNDPGITPETLAAMVDDSVAKHTPTAEQNAAAVVPLVADIAEQVLGADNAAQAEEIVNRLAARLGAPEVSG